MVKSRDFTQDGARRTHEQELAAGMPGQGFGGAAPNEVGHLVARQRRILPRRSARNEKPRVEAALQVRRRYPMVEISQSVHGEPPSIEFTDCRQSRLSGAHLG